MELARVVQRLGDDAVLERLSVERPRAVRLAAVRAAPFLRSPEIALEPLAELAGTRDPELAPAAAASVLTIARSLSADDLERREVDRASVTPVRRRLRALMADRTARADLRAAAALADDALSAIGVPAPT